MDELQNKINREKEHFKNLKNKTYTLGAVLIGLGIAFGILLSQGEGIAPVAGVLTAALYMGVGINLLTRSINIKHEENKAIRDIRIEDKLDRLLSRS